MHRIIKFYYLLDSKYYFIKVSAVLKRFKPEIKFKPFLFQFYCIISFRFGNAAKRKNNYFVQNI